MQGAGNDFVIVSGFSYQSLGDVSALAKKMCDRHYGAGAGRADLALPLSGRGGERSHIQFGRQRSGDVRKRRSLRCKVSV